MHSLIEPILVLTLLLNFFVLGSSRLRAVIHASAAQGVLLGVLALANGPVTARTLLFAIVTVFLKGALIPTMLLRAMREAAIRREVEPYIGFTSSVLLGALATGLAEVFAASLPLASAHRGSLLVPSSIATVLVGFLVLVTRKKAITQVVGYLILENGIFIMGQTLVEAVPLMVEAGVLLDLFVGIFVLGIIINHINREFASLDTARLSTLRD
ncbi:MAG: hydrogenase [Deltaproteobacteria bacterium]|nr:hydrogenase [Deltaproteobacteria bacterium]